MKVVLEKGMPGLATVYAASFRGRDDLILEFVDSLSGSTGVGEKWVTVVSSQFGCPVGCLMCDTNGYYRGNPTTEELFSQVEYMVKRRFGRLEVPSGKFKVQFARMGEPALNPNVIDAIIMIRNVISAPGLMPCISTIAPAGTGEFFDGLAALNHDIFKGRFQLQFSLHSTSEEQRNRIIPVEKWSLEDIADYGRRFYCGGRKVTLNFAMARENEMDVDVIRSLFSSGLFTIKITPVNPTENAVRNSIARINVLEEELPQIEELRLHGYDVILSVGDLRENEVGSNCGQLAAVWNRTRVDSPLTG